MPNERTLIILKPDCVQRGLLGAVLLRFEARGHITRMVDPRDRRASRVVLSAAGLTAHRAANVSFQIAIRQKSMAFPPNA